MSTLSPSHQHHLLQISSQHPSQQQQHQLQSQLPTIMESMDQSNTNSLVASEHSMGLNNGSVPPLPPLRLPSALASSNQLSSSSTYLPMISEESTATANVAIVTSGGTLPRSPQTPLTSTPHQQYYANSQFNHYDHHLQSQSMNSLAGQQQQQQQLNSISSQMGHLV